MLKWIALLFLEFASCISISGYVDPRSRDLNEIKVVINGGEYLSHLTEKGLFYFSNIPSGNHLLEVLSNVYSFDKVIIESNVR